MLTNNNKTATKKNIIRTYSFPVQFWVYNIRQPFSGLADLYRKICNGPDPV